MKILVRKNGQFFKEVDFRGTQFVIGRSSEADLQLLHEDISRKHILILNKNGSLTLEDLQSKNGTLFQGAPIRQATIKIGEVFFIGPFSISIENVHPQSEQTVVEHPLSEVPTSTFHIHKKDIPKMDIQKDDTHTSREVKPIDFSSFSEDNPSTNKDLKSLDSESFFDAISISPETTNPTFKEKDVSSSKKNDDSLSLLDPVTDPYHSVPQYLKEVAEREKLKSNKEIETEIVEYSTTPHDSLKDIEEEAVNEVLKTEVIQPESTLESALEDFPSSTNEFEEAKPSEQFFLNREIDAEGIPESFENFPDTNKISPSENVASSFVESSLVGKIEEDTEQSLIKTPPSIELSKPKISYEETNETPTGAFSDAETQHAPREEDQIKTFMFNPENLESGSHFEKIQTGEDRSSPKVKNSFKNFFIPKSEPEYKAKKSGRGKLLFVIAALGLGFLIYFLMEEGNPFNRVQADPETAINSEEGFQKLGRSERKRVILFQIDQIQKLIDTKDITEADERMRKLMVLAPKDSDFVTFEKKFQRQRDAIVAEAERKKKEEEEKQEKKASSLKVAQQLVDSGKFEQAKKTYTQLLDVFPDDPDVMEKIQTLELMQEQEERKVFAKKQRDNTLNRIFTEAVEKYESGQVGIAQNLFKQVTEDRGHSKYKKSMEYLEKIETMADQKIDQKVSKAKTMIQNPETLLQGYQELKKIVMQFPLRTDAKDFLDQAKIKMDKKARELYADGLAQEELAGDIPAAMDLYKEVLKYAPDPTNKYNQKAQEKINKLEM